MGLRGPGAKAKPKAGKGGAKVSRAREPWRKKGLSRAEKVIAFLESLPITKGILAGQKMKLLPNQREFVEAIYSDKPRTVRLAIKSEPRGNGKTGLIAGLCLAHLLGPESEQRGEVYSAAIDKIQAGLIFSEMRAIVEAKPELEERVNIQRFQKIIEVIDGDGKGSVYESLSADVRRAHGLAPSLWVYDEFAQAKTRELLDNLMTAMGKRTESLGIVISTQAADDHHPLSAMIDDALQGHDPTTYCQLTAAPDDCDPFNEEVWKAANPAWGVFLDEAEFRAQAARAERVPSFRQRFLNLRLNMRVDAEEKFIRATEWDACAEPVDLEKLAGRKCYGGLDLGSTRDLTSLVLVFPAADGSFDVLPFFWCPRDNLLDRETTDKVPYWTWAHNDPPLIEPTPGAATDHSFVVHRLGELAQQFDIQTVGFDRWRILDLQRQLAEEGIDVRLEPFGQGYKDMSPAIDDMERLIISRSLRHAGHPILRWNARNAVVTRDPAGNRKLDKERATEKIDGLAALCMALGMARRTEDDSLPACLAELAA